MEMHNQDTAKDDFLEALMAILAKAKEYYRKMREEGKKVTGEQEKEIHEDIKNGSKTDLEKVDNFKKAMEYIQASGISENVTNLAKQLHDNPVEGMKLIGGVVDNNLKEILNNYENLSKETLDSIAELKQKLDVTTPEGKERLNSLDTLEKSENDKIKFVNELKQTGVMKNVYSEKEVVPLLQKYFDNLDKSLRDKYKNEPEISVVGSELKLKFDHIKDPGYTSLELNMDLINGEIKEIHHSTTEEKGSWKGVEDVINKFNINDLKNENEQEQNEPEKETEITVVEMEIER